MEIIIAGVGGESLKYKLERLELIQPCYFRLFQRADETMIFAAQQRPQVVIADYRLPDIDGLSVLYRVRHVSPDSIRILCGVDAAARQFGSVLHDLYAYVDARTDPSDLSAIVNIALTSFREHQPRGALDAVSEIDDWVGTVNAPSLVTALPQ